MFPDSYFHVSVDIPCPPEGQAASHLIDFPFQKKGGGLRCYLKGEGKTLPEGGITRIYPRSLPTPPAALDILIYPGLAEDPEGLRPPSALRSAEAFSLYYKVRSRLSLRGQGIIAHLTTEGEEESHIGRPGKALATTEGRGPCSCCAHTD